jgi:hypothetical protein
MYLYEGGNVFADTVDIKKEFVPALIQQVQQMLPGYAIEPHIGSAGFKVASGDMDLFLDQNQVVDKAGTKDDKKDPVKAAKAWLASEITGKTGLQTSVKGRNVHVRMPLPDKTFGQVDLMVIPDSKGVAPWHQHGPRGSYEDPDFKGAPIFILMNSIGKPLNLKFDAFSGRLLDRTTNEPVAGPDRDSVAARLIPGATGDDFNSVKSIMNALANDPDRDIKLAQAREDQTKGILNLHEPMAEGTWMRRMNNILRRV